MRIFGFDIHRTNKNSSDLHDSPTLSAPERKYSVVNADRYLEMFTPAHCHKNYAFMFHNIAEVQFPIVYVSRRISNAKFVLRKSSDDSIVWADSTRGIKDKYVANIIEKRLLNQPNPYMTFKEFIFNAFVNKLLFGNSYVYAFTNKNSGKLWETCNEFYVLQSAAVEVETLYGNVIGKNHDVKYRYSDYSGVRSIDSSLIYHVKDMPSFVANQQWSLMGKSRLDALKYQISNICAVYEARNVIYVKRGAMGLIVNQDRDIDGSVALTPRDKENMRKEFYETYGLESDKMPVAIMDKPVTYIPIGMSIGELQPFTECLLDAASIAGAYGVDSNLIPRENNPTYSNLNTAELNVYTSVAIPELASWLDGFNQFLGLYDAGYYIDALWDDIAIMQENIQRKETAKASISNRCRNEFNAGLITLNDWRIAIGRERLENAIYNKTLLEMTEEEIIQLKSKITL